MEVVPRPKRPLRWHFNGSSDINYLMVDGVLIIRLVMTNSVIVPTLESSARLAQENQDECMPETVQPHLRFFPYLVRDTPIRLVNTKNKCDVVLSI